MLGCVFIGAYMCDLVARVLGSRVCLVQQRSEMEMARPAQGRRGMCPRAVRRLARLRGRRYASWAPMRREGGKVRAAAAAAGRVATIRLGGASGLPYG
jgi:hypothetical protein